jgi:hypothetical protein
MGSCWEMIYPLDREPPVEPDRGLVHRLLDQTRLVVAAIEMAVARRGEVVACILDTPIAAARSGPEGPARPQAARHGRLTGQLGSAGAAAMESCLALLHRNVLDRHRWDSSP